MKFEFKPSFDKSVKRFHGEEKEDIKNVAIKIIDILSKHKQSHKVIFGKSEKV